MKLLAVEARAGLPWWPELAAGSAPSTVAEWAEAGARRLVADVERWRGSFDLVLLATSGSGPTYRAVVDPGGYGAARGARAAAHPPEQWEALRWALGRCRELGAVVVPAGMTARGGAGEARDVLATVAVWWAANRHRGDVAVPDGGRLTLASQRHAVAALVDDAAGISLLYETRGRYEAVREADVAERWGCTGATLAEALVLGALPGIGLQPRPVSGKRPRASVAVELALEHGSASGAVAWAQALAHVELPPGVRRPMVMALRAAGDGGGALLTKTTEVERLHVLPLDVAALVRRESEERDGAERDGGGQAAGSRRDGWLPEVPRDVGQGQDESSSLALAAPVVGQHAEAEEHLRGAELPGAPGALGGVPDPPLTPAAALLLEVAEAASATVHRLQLDVGRDQGAYDDAEEAESVAWEAYDAAALSPPAAAPTPRPAPVAPPSQTRTKETETMTQQARDTDPRPRRPFAFRAVDATREAILLRAAFAGKSNSGKSWTAMLTATHLAERLGLGPVYVIDSENGAALRYAKSPKTGHGFTFKHVAMPPDDYSPETYIEAIDYCESMGARVILADGISQEWTDAPGCVLENVDAITEAASAAKAARGNDKKASAFSTGWAEMSPRHNVFVQRMLRCSAHFIATMRCKTEYKVDASGTPRKVGLAPIQRPGVEYEFDLLFTMDDAVLTVGKTRCDRIAPGTVITRPGVEFADLLVDWIQDTDQAPAEVAKALADYVRKMASEGTPEARARLLASMRERRVVMPEQTTALRMFDDIVAAKPAAGSAAA